MTFEEIVKESIKSVVCIDDRIASPYQEDDGDKEFSNDLYEGIRTSLNSTILMIPYKKLKGVEEVFKNRDLLILDWDLEEPEVDVSKTLTLVEAALHSEIQYICIYTKEDTLTVKNVMLRYFSGYTQEEISDLYEKVLTDGIFLEQIFGLNPDDICSEDAFNNSSIRSKIGKLGIDPNKEYGNLYNPGMLYKLYLAYMNHLNKCPLPTKSGLVHEYPEKSKSYFYVNNKIVMVFKKSNPKERKESEVEASKLVDRITDAVISEPNSILTLAWLFYSNELYRQLVSIESPLSGVNLQAFTYTYNQFGEKDQDGAKDFLKKLYFQEIESRVDLMRLSLPKSIIDKLPPFDFQNDVLTDSVKDGLFFLNMLMNTNQSLSKKEHLLSFGDVFKYEGSYWMCVSAKCDCANPENNKKNYIFIRGVEKKGADVLDGAEGKFISFVPDGKNKANAVKWSDRIFIGYVDEPKVRIGHKIKVQITASKKDEVEIEYLTTINPDYAQRMANNVFSFANRVGVSFAQYPPKNSDEDSE